MPVERFYCPTELRLNETIDLVDQEFHHLAHVIRAEVGDSIEIVNGKGILAHATIETLQKRKAHLKIVSVSSGKPSSFKMILAQAMPRMMNRLDTVLEKATELGMDEIWLFPTQLGERKLLTTHRIERFSSITISAMKQCGRLFLPKVVMMPQLEEWKTLPCPSFFGDLSPEAPLFKDKWKNREGQTGVLFFIGPESGFSDKEELELKRLGAAGVRLHRNILRTETAAIMACSLMSHI